MMPWLVGPGQAPVPDRRFWRHVGMVGTCRAGASLAGTGATCAPGP